MIVTKFHENRLTIHREISEKHAILVTFNVTLGIVCLLQTYISIYCKLMTTSGKQQEVKREFSASSWCVFVMLIII